MVRGEKILKIVVQRIDSDRPPVMLWFISIFITFVFWSTYISII